MQSNPQQPESLPLQSAQPPQLSLPQQTRQTQQGLQSQPLPQPQPSQPLLQQSQVSDPASPSTAPGPVAANSRRKIGHSNSGTALGSVASGSSVAQRRPLLVMNVNTPTGTKTLQVFSGDDPLRVAEEFCRSHGIDRLIPFVLKQVRNKFPGAAESAPRRTERPQ